MRFLINGRVVEINIKLDDLFAAIMQMPGCQAKPDDFMRLSKLPQDNMIGTQEKGYIVVTPKDNIRIGGTDGILHCIGMSFHDPHNSKLVIAHLDIGIEPQSLNQVLAEFKNAKIVNIRLFGGMTQKEAATIAGYTHQDSINLAKNICYFLYQIAAQCTFDINILSTDLFDKLQPYKTYASENLPSNKIGLAIDSKTGLIVCLENQPFPFSVQIDNCGLFQGVYKERGVCVRMHDYLDFSGSQLAKRFDNTIPGWQESYWKEIEERSIHGIISILIDALNSNRFAVNQPYAFTDGPLKMFISANLPLWLKQLGVPQQSYQQLLMDHICFNIIKGNNTLLQNFRYHARNELPLERIVLLGVIQRWCFEQTRNFITQHLYKSDEDKQWSLLQLLNSFKGSMHLLNELVEYQLINDDVEKKRREVNPTLIAKLKGIPLDQAAKIIIEWKQQVINAGVNRFATNIFANLSGDFKRPEINELIHDVIRKIFENYHAGICDLDIFHELNQPMNRKLIEIAQQMQAAFEQIQKQVQDMRHAVPNEQSFCEALCLYFARPPTPPPLDINQVLQEQAQKVISEILNKNFGELTQTQILPVQHAQSENTASKPLL